MPRRYKLARVLFASMLIICLITGTAGCMKKKSPDNTGNTTVPGVYESLYSGLDSDLDRYDAFLDTRDAGQTHPVTFGTELLTANSNRGQELLKPDVMAGNKLYLDRLQELGAQGVTISIGYPVYSRPYPGYEGYRDFYRGLAQEIRKRNMTLCVETSVTFTNTVYSDISYDFKGLSFADYRSHKKGMVEDILADMKPDYLSLGSEPDTEYKLTGYAELNSPEKYREMIDYMLDGIGRGDTKIGAGIGSWGNLDYVKGYVTDDNFDFIDIHVYPVNGQYLQNIAVICDIARQHNKSVIMTEAWLYKTESPGVNIAMTADIFKLDMFSFWEPLDARFFDLIARTARVEGVEYVSPFWSTYFFGTLDYEDGMSRASYATLRDDVNKAAVANMLADRFTPLGEHFKKLINDNKTG